MIPLIIVAALLAPVLAALCAWLGHQLGARNHDLAWNGQLGVSEHADGCVARIADAAWAQRYLLVKEGTDWQHIAVCAATSDEPEGVCIDAAYAQGDGMTVRLPGAHKGTTTMIAAGAIAANADLYSDGTGQVTGAPVAAGIYWLVGKLVGVAPTAAGDMVEVEAIKPVKVVVVAALTSAQIGADPVQADYNKLQADVAALATALATPALVKHL